MSKSTFESYGYAEGYKLLPRASMKAKGYSDLAQRFYDVGYRFGQAARKRDDKLFAETEAIALTLDLTKALNGSVAP